MTPDPSADRLAGLLSASRRLLVFTGAGLSTGSGIPDFRGPGGVWTRRQPVYFQDFLASDSARREYWDQKCEAHDVFRAARPNAGHLAIAELERRGVVRAIVTQNIDGLHQAAGTSDAKLVEVHGTNRLVECVTCGGRRDPQEPVDRFRATGEPPLCDCGGWLKFATISFGQPLREAALHDAAAAASACDLVLAVGSTLSVMPAASIPLLALRRGTPYAIVNRGPTDHDAVATLRLEGDACEILPAAVAAMGAPPSRDAPPPA